MLRATLLALFALGATAAHAQTERTLELIERAMSLEPGAARGASLYAEHCGSCHGSNAHGDARSVTPAIAGQVTTYLLKQLADIAEGDRMLPEMHRTVARSRLHSPQALRDLATYVNGLPANRRNEVGDGENLGAGKRIYGSLCALCHGDNGEGHEEFFVPKLYGQHYSYTLMQMRRLAVGHRYAVEAAVIRELEALSFDELTGVADYVSRLPVPEPLLAQPRH